MRSVTTVLNRVFALFACMLVLPLANAQTNCFTKNPSEQVCYSGVFPANPIIVGSGQSTPLPATIYDNRTTSDVTFTIEWAGVDIAGSGIIHSATVPANSQATFTNLTFAVDPSIAIGTHNIVIGWSAQGGGFATTSQRPFELVVLLPEKLREVIQVPARWCAVEGSKQAQGHQPGETVPGVKLLSLLQKMNNDFWLPQAGILFRHAFAPQGIPVIKDPHVGNDNLGDLALSNNDEWHTAGVLCEQAWSARYPDQRGTVMVNALTVIPDTFTIVGGVAPAVPFNLRAAGPTPGQRANDLCAHPRKLMVADVTPQMMAIVYDQALFKAPGSRYTSDTLQPVRTLAHELGHTLMLGHGNGLDDNHDGLLPPATGVRRFDEYCDPLGDKNGNGIADEDELTPFVACDTASVMGPGACQNLQPLQREMARAAAKLVPGAVVTDPTLDPAGYLVAEPGACSANCGIPDSLVLRKVEMAETPDRAVTSFSHTVLHLLPPNASNRYLVFADLDNNRATGCSISEPGIPRFDGGELMTEVALTVSGGVTTATPAVWRCSGGAWVKASDPQIGADAFAQTPAAHDQQTIVGAGIITIHMPDSVRGPAGAIVRLQAVARGNGAVNLLPAGGAGGVLALIPPELPACSTSSSIAQPGQSIGIAADSLQATRNADIFVGDQIVSTAVTDSNGSLQANIIIPATSGQGVRALEVRVQGGAASAVCTVLVQGNALTPATTASLSPQPNSNDWNNSAVDVALNAVDVPGGTGIKEISYSATGAQPIVPTTRAGASATFKITTEGRTVIRFFATNNASLSEAAHTVTVSLDQTPPTITFAGNKPSYGVLETIQISCVANDTLSGVLLDTCKNITGPAYAFAPGANMFSATATDFAGNVGSGSVNFVLNVTYGDLCTLTRQFIAQSSPSNANGLGTSLCAHLANAEAANARGNATAKRAAIDVYVKQVGKASPDVFSAETVRILTNLARAL